MNSAVASTIQTKPSLVRAFVALFKLRVVSLLLFAAVGGAFLGANGWPGIGPLTLVLVTGLFAGAGASALNHYFERDKDALMNRTRNRPLVSGVFERIDWVPYVGVAMVVVPSLLVLPFRPALTFFLLLGGFIYAGLYTLVLKPRTLLNIVIGGAAGSAAVLSGSAAVGTWYDPGAVVLALLVFVWTPSHFWSLAMVYRDDYMRSDTPMLPTQTTPRYAAYWILLHTIATVFAALLLSFHASLGWLYFVPVFVLALYMVKVNWQLIQNPTGKLALKLFKWSNLYLAVVLLMICIDGLI
ncbi:MAG: heme o synthase [Chloroflexota bacterium]